MPADIVIKGGTVFDGSGAPGRDADVAITDGVIVEIGPNLSGDARARRHRAARSRPASSTSTRTTTRRCSGIPALRPSSFHGVTTVVAGNCGFAIAPTRPEFRDTIVHTLENVEDMDPATLVAGVAWDFETFPEYLDSVQRRGTALNFTAYVGHSALRLYVMGDAAYERAATADEIERMCELLREAIAAGAAGFSTSFSYAHRGVDGKPVPSRFAERDEVHALFRAAGEAGKGVVLITPGEQCTYADVYEWQPIVGRPFTYPLFAAPGGKHLEPVRLHEDGLANGAQRVAAGHAAAAHDAVHARRSVQPQHRAGVRRADEGEPRRAAGGVPRPRVARAGGRRPRAVADEAALGHVRGLRVAAVPRAAGPAGAATSRTSAAAARST